VTFDLLSVRFHFAARGLIQFPAGLPGNILRGALGSAFRKIACAPECPGWIGKNIRECALRANCVYARIFEPSSISPGPSGLADWPRPFVIRARHLSDCLLRPGEAFWFEVHLFDTRDPPVEHFRHAFDAMAAEGLGPGRGKAELVTVEQSPVSISLDPRTGADSRIRVEFRTPTELKSGEQVVARPEFAVLFARSRDRVSSLRALYGAGPLEIGFRELGERSHAIQLVRCDLQPVEVMRHSSRTGQRHGIGGFVGVVEYQGDLSEFLPYLDAAHWSGVGRHCVWGNGEIATEVLT
jgi:hypothetical protein